jgi:ABC-2 type transport system permease protein
MNDLAGTGELVRLGLRRDRIMIPVWAYALTATAVATAYSYAKLYDTVAARLDFADGVRDNTSTLAFYGHVYQLGSTGGLVAWRLAGIGAALAGVLSILLVVRHTRADEEAGRLELVSAGVVGRYAPLTAGLLIAVVADVLLAALVFAGLVAVGMPAAGSVAFALGWMLAGVVFAAVAAVAAQLSASARTANGIALAVLGVAFLLRAVGDAGPSWLSWLSWLSPVGWSEQVRAFADNRWRVAALAVPVAAIVAATAFALAGRRDLGAGILPARPGPACAGPGLRSPLALAWRLQRGLLLAWTVGLAVYGAAIGGIAQSVNDLVKGSTGTRKLLIEMGGEKGVIDAFLATAMGILGLAASVYAVQAVLRLRTEESALRAEPLLATRVGRIGWAMSHLVFAVAGPAVLLTVAGLGAGVTHGLGAHDLGSQVPRVLGGALVQLPAVWVLAGVTLVIFGFAPRFAQAAWAVLGAFLLLGLLGPVLEFAQWAMDVSPFTHVPKIPGSALPATPVVALTLVGVALAVAGLAGLRRRDIG